MLAVNNTTRANPDVYLFKQASIEAATSVAAVKVQIPNS